MFLSFMSIGNGPFIVVREQAESSTVGFYMVLDKRSPAVVRGAFLQRLERVEV